MLALHACFDELSLERRIVVDMSGVRFMDSSGLKVILAQQMARYASAHHRQLCSDLSKSPVWTMFSIQQKNM